MRCVITVHERRAERDDFVSSSGSHHHLQRTAPFTTFGLNPSQDNSAVGLSHRASRSLRTVPLLPTATVTGSLDGPVMCGVFSVCVRETCRLVGCVVGCRCAWLLIVVSRLGAHFKFRPRKVLHPTHTHRHTQTVTTQSSA